MKTSVKWIVAAALACTALAATANEEHHKDKAAPAQTAKAAKPSNKAVNDQMQKLQTARDKLAAAKSSTERQIAMQEGMQAMKDAMTMMRDMGGKGCMSMNMGKGMAKDGDKADGMGMMDMMMQMMDQQSSMMAMPMDKKE